MRTALDQQGRKILDVDIAQQIGLVFDIDPQKMLVGVECRQFFELRAVVATDVAPGGAQAGDQQVIAAQPLLQSGKRIGVQGQDGHGAQGE